MSSPHSLEPKLIAEQAQRQSIPVIRISVATNKTSSCKSSLLPLHRCPEYAGRDGGYHAQWLYRREPGRTARRSGS